MKEVKLKVSADTKNAEKGMKRVDKSIQGTVGSLLKATAAIYAMKKAMDFSVEFKNFARDAIETESKFNTVFSSMNESATAMAESFADSFGLASSTAKELLGDTGDLLIGFGFTEEKAIELSKSINSLSLDMRSFKNIQMSASEVSSLMVSAMSGNVRAIRSFGIVLRLEEKELQNSIKTYQEKLGYDKKQAVALAILDASYQQSQKAVGDFARTQDDLANKERITSEKVKELKEAIGSGLIPMFESGNDFAQTFADTLKEELAPALEEIANEFSSAENKKKFQEAGSDLAKAVVFGVEHRKGIVQGAGMWIGASLLFGMGKKIKGMYSAVAPIIIKSATATAKALAPHIKALGVGALLLAPSKMGIIDAEEELIEASKKSAEKFYKEYSQYYDLLKKANNDKMKAPTTESFIPIKMKLIWDEDLSVDEDVLDEITSLDQDRIDRRTELRDQWMEEQANANYHEIDIYKEMLNEKIISDEEYTEKKKELDNVIAMSNLQTIGSMIGGFASLNKAMKGSAIVSKRLSQAEAIINTYVGANKALAQGGIMGYVAMAGIIASGLANVATIEAQKFSGGGDFVVPNGYPNDSYPILVESGERVQITPASGGNSNLDGDILNALHQLISKPVANTVVFDDIDMSRYVESGTMRRDTI